MTDDVPERRFIKYFWDNDNPPLETKRYTIDTLGVVRYAVSYAERESPNISWDESGYAFVSITHNKKQYKLRIARIVASTFLGPPPDLTHTADHVYRNRNDDRLDNIRWLDLPGQRANQERSETLKSALIIVNEQMNKEMTAKEWTEVFKKKNGESYNERTIRLFAEQKKHGFSYKEYPDLEGEVWKPVVGSENKKGRWEASNMCRMKYITIYADNVFSDERLGLINGYPVIKINGKQKLCHIVIFKTWFPDLYAAMKPEELILHENDNRKDFRPEKLRIGTQSMNMKDAHDNGKYDDTSIERKKCASYINGVLEKEYISQSDAANYLQSHGWPKADPGNISKALSGIYKSAYNRTWKCI